MKSAHPPLVSSSPVALPLPLLLLLLLLPTTRADCGSAQRTNLPQAQETHCCCSVEPAYSVMAAGAVVMGGSTGIDVVNGAAKAKGEAAADAVPLPLLLAPSLKVLLFESWSWSPVPCVSPP